MVRSIHPRHGTASSGVVALASAGRDFAFKTSSFHLHEFMGPEENLRVSSPRFLIISCFREIVQPCLLLARLWSPLKQDRVSEIKASRVIRRGLSQALSEAF